MELETKSLSKKRAFLRFAPDIILDLIKGKIKVHLKNLPEDAIIQYIYHDWETNTFNLLVTSSSFEEVPLGEKPPYLTDKMMIERIEK